MQSSKTAPAAIEPSAPAVQGVPPLTVERVIGFMAMVFGMFMAILDIQIVSASLSEIQAGLSASADEIPWVQTSYLIAEVIMIPLSGYLSRAFSTRYLFAFSAAGFTVMSVLCSTATSIEEMIVYRALQGFIGGGMIPTVFASAYSIFPREKQPIIAPIIGLVATMAPTIGPTIGGYLTELFSWHWLFLVNLLPGILVTVVTWTMVDFDEPEPSLLQNFDWTGLVSMALFLGSLEYVLEEGSAKDWFNSEAVTWCAVVSACSAAVFAWRCFVAPQPIVDMTAFNNRNFWTGSLMSVVLGIGLYGLTYLYPVYLARVRGYSALMIGETMFVTGISMFIAAPIVGRLSAGRGARLMIALGFAGFAWGTWLATDITKDWDFWELLVPQFLRGFCMMMCMVPINNLALGTLPPNRLKNASGLYNLTRNLGGALGLALINTQLNERTDLHMLRLREHIAWGHFRAEEVLADLTFVMSDDPVQGLLMATRKIAFLVRREAVVMAMSDVFLMLTLLYVVLVLLVPFMRPTAHPAGPDSGAH
jgi:DHA2 family multidrug resistance protein